MKTRNYIIFGIQILLLSVVLLLAILFPWVTIQSVTLMFAVLLIIQGVFSMIEAITNFGLYIGSIWYLLFGILSLIAGFGIIYYPITSITILGYVLAGWVLISGFLNIIEGFIIKREKPTEIFLIISGILSIFLSILIFIFPANSIAGFMWFFAIYLVLWIVFEWSQTERIRNI
ncbi:hypothetical protein GF362_03945 [Candidatus Dojkabacteria bacterium]|nr:hypothetical protein [Candidatus Dojkabacteria bacterium]